MNFRNFWPGSRHLRPCPDRPDPISSLTELLSTHPINRFLSNPHSLLNRARRAQRKFLAWFQTPQTVSRPSRPDFQPRKTNSGTRRPIEIFKKRKMIRIEFPEFLAWFQTPQTVSRPSRPLVLAGIQVVSCAARPLTLRVASGYRGGVFFELTRD